MKILAINGGSSSIKFALFTSEAHPQLLLDGALEKIGTAHATLHYKDAITHQKKTIAVAAANHLAAANVLLNWFTEQELFTSIDAIGHRVVHGMHHTETETITPELLSELHQISGYDPDHLPEEIQLIELFAQHYPTVAQVACFDTSFHTTMPAVAKMLAIPRRYFKKGIQRYGFHGLSYAYLMGALQQVAGNEVAEGKIILAHLGSGASLAAVTNGKSVDTSMGFTPTAGLPMGTRSGDLDPGVAWYLMQFEKMGPKAFSQLVNNNSGLLGISETSGDLQQLMEIEDTDSRAAEAIDLFCYQTKKWIGSFAAVLGGLETLVFAGGIGEHSPEVRSKICDGLGFLGIELCEIKNMNNEAIISTTASKVTVRVIPTNEALMMAHLVHQLLTTNIKN